MLKMAKRILLVVSLFLAILLVGCGKSSQTPQLDFEKKEMSIKVGETFTLSPIYIEVENGSLIEYTFDKEGVIEHQSGNTFKAIGEGDVVITATLKEHKKATSTVKVNVALVYTVKFVDKDGNILKTIEVAKGASATAPTAPSVDGYTFKGWDQEFNNVTSDLEVKAIYEKTETEKYTVTFKDKDGNVLKTIEVAKGASATAPTAPSVEGYTFKGWDQEFNNVTSDLEVKAIYEKTTVLATEIELLNELNVFKIKLGESVKLKWKVLPSEASQKVDISSLDDTVAMVLDDGTVVALGEGNTYIVLKTLDGSNVEYKIEIYVYEKQEVADTEKPEFVLASGTTSKVELNWNTKFDPLAGVTAKDNVDGDLTKNIKVTHEVDNKTYGTYEVKYEVTDKAGNVAEMTRTVEVVWNYGIEFIGHAGSYYGLMNSEEAILYAIQVLKYQAVEVDLKQTSDGVFVLCHDDTFAGYTLASTSWSVLKDVTRTASRSGGYPSQNGSVTKDSYTTGLCTLERYLEICKQYGVKAVIELKSSAGITNSDQSRMKALMNVIEKCGMRDKTIFLASQYNCLIWTRNNGYSDIECQYLVNSCESDTYLERCKQYDFTISINVTGSYSNSDEWLAKYQDAGIKISTYTYTQWVDYSTVQEWINKGVNYVTCDWHLMDKLTLPAKESGNVNTYTVTFKDSDGTVLKTSTVKEGRTAAAPSVTAKPGYEFTGWDKDITNVKADLVVTAKYSKITYTINYVNTLNNTTVEEWATKEAFAAELYNDFYNWLLSKAGVLAGITKNGNTITVSKNGSTASVSSGADILAVDIYVFELTLSNYIYKPVTRASDGSCVIEPSEDYFLNSDAYREKYKEVDQMLYRCIKNRYTSYNSTYTPTSAGKIQIFFRFHQWLQGKATINEFLPLAKKYIVTESNVQVTMPTTPNSYDVESEITLPTPTSTLEFLGWYTNPNFTGSQVTKITKGTTGNLVLYAKWKTE